MKHSNDCESAWGPDADRHDKPLRQLTWAGSFHGADSQVDQITVCGAKKAIYLGQSEAGVRGWGIADIKKALNAALAKGSSSLPDIECD